MNAKTQKKSLPAHLTPGNPGNSGGKKGRSGRKANNFIEWCKAVSEDPMVQGVFTARAKAGDVKVLTLAANYAHGRPTERVELTGKDGGPLHVESVEVVRERLPRRIAGIASRLGTAGSPQRTNGDRASGA